MIPVNKVHQDKHLTQISIGYKNEDFIGDQIFLGVPVGKQSDKYFVYGKERYIKREDMRAPGTESNEVHWTFSDDTYYAEAHALKTFVTDEELENADEIIKQELESAAAELTMDGILLNKEIDAARKLTDITAIHSSLHKDLTAGANLPWTHADSMPHLDVKAADAAVHAKGGVIMNYMAVSKPVYDALLVNKALITLLGANTLKMLSHDMLEFVFGKKLLVGKAQYGADKGTGFDAALNYIWGNAAVLFRVAPRATGKRTQTTGLSFNWNKPGEGFISTRKWYDNAKHAQIVENECRYDQKIIMPDSSFIFLNPLGN